MAPTTPVSLGDAARSMSDALGRELGVEPLARELTRILRSIAEEWIDLEVGDAPAFATDITDDGSPFEFSVALEDSRVELRVLAEAQQFPYDLASNWRAGLAATERLAQAQRLDLARFRSIEALFRPTAHSPGPFAIWHAAALREGQPALLKIYLNPAARGAGMEQTTVAEALERLGLGRAWEFLEQKLSLTPSARLCFFSLDLSSEKAARVKVYLAYPAAETACLERAMEGSEGLTAGAATAFVEAVTGQVGPFSKRPLLVCYAFSADREVPVSTLHVPVRCYVEHDWEVLERCEGLVPAAVRHRVWRAAQRAAGRALDRRAGLVTYASARSAGESQRLTLYLAPQLYSPEVRALRSSAPPAHSYVAPRGQSLAGNWAQPSMLTVQDAIHRARLLLREHPFIQRLSHGADLEQLRAMTRGLTFYVMAFQDVLRLSRMTISDPTLRALAETHEKEDRGHEQWFLHDAQRLGSTCDLRTVFSPEHETVRDVSYSLIAEVLMASDDRQRLAVVLCLEAAGAEFFHRVIAQLERLGEGCEMRYFARSHQAVEESHEVFESEAQLRLASVSIPARTLGAVLESVERSFVSLARLADEMDRCMALPERARSVA